MFSYLADVGVWFKTNINFPAIVLIVLLAFTFWVFRKAQANPANGFDLTDMLKDENGKASSMRFSVLVAMAISSWAIMTMVINNQLDPTAFIGYIAFWSSSAVAAKFVEAYQAVKGAPPLPPAQ